MDKSLKIAQDTLAEILNDKEGTPHFIREKCAHAIAEIIKTSVCNDAIKPTYYVQHPDGSYSEADSQPSPVEQAHGAMPEVVVWPKPAPEDDTWTICPKFLSSIQEISDDEYMPSLEGIQAVLLAIPGHTTETAQEQGREE